MSESKSFESYQVLSHVEHVLKLPDTYISSTTTTPESRWVLGSDGKMAWKMVQFNPGLYKLFDEIIVNARDAFVRASTTEGRLPVKHIDVTVANGVIRVENDGDGIPVEEHPTEKCQIVELIFGRLLTSSNYDEGKDKIVGGKNGYGAKLTNIFSRRFTVETQHPVSGKKCSQTWRNNMAVCEKPSVRKATGAKGYVAIEFEPDTSRFAGAFTDGTLTDDMMAVFHTRVVELAAMVGTGVKVTWNGVTLANNTFDKFIKLFLKDAATIAYESCGPRWEVGAVLARQLYSEDEGLPDETHISFVNGIQTRKGGKHVEYVAKNVLTDFCEAAKKKKVEIKPGQLKDHVVFFVNSTIVNPSFDSQTKECLTTPATKFGSTPKFTGKLVDSLVKLGLIDEAKMLLESRAARDAKKTDGKKRSTLRGLPKLDDALWAGTARSAECTLILTEGDSAKTSAISGLNEVGREAWGVFPLKGKIVNVRDITVQKFNANEELAAIKRILGLEHGKVYTSLKELRYGRVMIMADQDHDGSHIKGLVMNLFHTEWPSLLTLGFLCTLKTPILKALRGSTAMSFYTLQEFEAWRREHSIVGWHIKYYKGLGTSTPAETREWFRALQEIKYICDERTDDVMTLAFSKKRADDRKDWLKRFDPERSMAVTDAKATYSEFVNGELIHFSNADNIRSIPHMMDGFKPSHRKIMYSCLKRNLRSEIRVAQLSGYVSENAGYHHGEASLNATIVGMAQNFMGSNNLNLLKPIGQFGSRLQGGDDSASPRYIHTHLEAIVDSLFRKEDQALLKAVDDDGQKVEPEYYLPVVPLLAINGTTGIGTGYSSDILPHNPTDILTLLKHRLSGSLSTLAGRALDPWWFGFKGDTKRVDEHTWSTHGLYTFDEEKHTITVTELPVGMWTTHYKIFLDKLLTGEGSDAPAAAAIGLKAFDDLSDTVRVHFVLTLTEEAFDDAVANPAKFEKTFKLVTPWKTSNMHCFDTDFVITKYSTIGDILEAFVAKRLPSYEARRLKQLDQIRVALEEFEAKRAFLSAVLEGRLDIMRKTDEEIVGGLRTCGIPPLTDPARPESVDAYEYVLRMRIDRLKASAIDTLDGEIRELRGKREALERDTPVAMWLSDLADFEETWKTYADARTAEMAGTAASSDAKGKKRVKKVVVTSK